MGSCALLTLEPFQRGLCPVGSQLVPGGQELGVEVLLGQGLVVHHRHGVDPGQDQVLGHLKVQQKSGH